jgi:hypothetical protein
VDTSGLLVLAGLTALALCGVGVWLTVRVTRRVRRALPNAVDRVGSRARAFVPGPAGQVARARCEVRASLQRVRAAWGVAAAGGLPVGDTAAVLTELDRAVTALDARLRVIGTLVSPGSTRYGGAALRRPGSEVLTSSRAFTTALEQARSLTGAADHLADALLDVVAAAGSDVSDVATRCSIEATALRQAATSIRAIT